MKFPKLMTSAMAGTALLAAPAFAQDTGMETMPAPDETPAVSPYQDPATSEAPAPTEAPPATIDTNGDGTMDAWDQRGDGKADTWDTDGDGLPDAVDNDGDGQPDPVNAPPTEPVPSEAGPGAEASNPPSIDSNGDGTMDAWDVDNDGVADTWDIDGDGQPDSYDTDGDGAPDPT